MSSSSIEFPPDGTAADGVFATHGGGTPQQPGETPQQPGEKLRQPGEKLRQPGDEAPRHRPGEVRDGVDNAESGEAVTAASQESRPDDQDTQNGANASISQARLADEKTVTSLVETHQAGLWRYLRALGCDSAAAEDIVQDTFVTLLRTPFEDQGEAAVAGYLRTIARNLFISRQRRERRMRSVAEMEDIDECWREWVQDESGDDLIEALKSCFRKLTSRAQQALQLRFRDRASRAEIAAALEMTEHGAKNLMQRAKHQLRGCIETKIK